ncbi:hypothetical protein scyTo_0014735 [Scyliorhinus torazame]|uniref:Uncharacterized protein n=1 Tax=Scyliorhinus torazame TaxID=75743 RepID=A0A401NTI4_SCYTO|nr:hypothetical protein [Scyliorhinus torazame]
MNGLQSNIEILKVSIERYEELLTGEERALIWKAQAEKEEGFQELAALQDEKLEQVNKVTDLERLEAELDITWHVEKKPHGKAILQAVQLAEGASKRENLNLSS